MATFGHVAKLEDVLFKARCDKTDNGLWFQ